MAFRNVFIKFREDQTRNIMSGELDVEYTGEIYYDVKCYESGFSWPGDGIYSPPDGDIYYTCTCDLKEIKSFKKVEKE